MEADITSQAVGLASNTDFSILQLFLRADFIDPVNGFKAGTFIPALRLAAKQSFH